MVSPAVSRVPLRSLQPLADVHAGFSASPVGWRVAGALAAVEGSVGVPQLSAQGQPAAVSGNASDGMGGAHGLLFVKRQQQPP